jgi:hypothetical protein
MDGIFDLSSKKTTCMKNQLQCYLILSSIFLHISCGEKKTVQAPLDPNLFRDTLQFVYSDYEDRHNLPIAFFSKKNRDTLVLYTDSLISTDAMMHVFEVLYERDTALVAMDRVESMRLKSMRLLESVAPFYNSLDPQKQLFFDLTGQWPMYCQTATISEQSVMVGIIDVKNPAQQSYLFIPFSKTVGSTQWVKQEQITYTASSLQLLEPILFDIKNGMPHIYFYIIDGGSDEPNKGNPILTMGLYNFDRLLKISSKRVYEKNGTQFFDYDFNKELQKVIDAGHIQAYLVFKEMITRCNVLDNPGFHTQSNFQKEWESANIGGITEYFKDGSNSEGIINWVEYDSSPLPVEKASDMRDTDHYIIYSFFRNSVIGYNKDSKRYFTIYAETCESRCTKRINFLLGPEEDLFIRWEEYDPQVRMVVNLVSGEYSIVTVEPEGNPDGN